MQIENLIALSNYARNDQTVRLNHLQHNVLNDIDKKINDCTYMIDQLEKCLTPNDVTTLKYIKLFAGDKSRLEVARLVYRPKRSS